MANGGDKVRLVRDASSGVEAIRARFAGHAYDLHRHDDWLVGVTDHGVQDFYCRGERRRSTPDRVILIEPQEAHDGQAGGTDGFAYTMVYLPRAWLRAALRYEHDDRIGFRATLADHRPLGRAVRTAFDALADPASRLHCDGTLDAVAMHLAPQLGQQTGDLSPGRDIVVARRARERLLDALHEDIGADALAAAAGAADRFQLARLFRAAYGAAPHVWLVQMRLLRAREMLAQGAPPAAVAASCGFADQSHLGRWFRRAYGVTPAAYRARCTGVPDTRPPIR
ncbi:MAG TPA: AraC family transcriptional regulator [Acetobacteraceae bacterium]|nr:AraC family transcriptional regulator [Acetobacteraceae bacterium]